EDTSTFLTEMNFSKTAHQYAGLLELTLQKARYSLRRSFSHSNEQEILKGYTEELLDPRDPRTVVDIGAGNGIRWSNSYALVLEGWNAIGIEADAYKYELLEQVYRRFPNAKACNRRVQPNSIERLLKGFGVERTFSVLCLDIDSNDYWILDAILSYF